MKHLLNAYVFVTIILNVLTVKINDYSKPLMKCRTLAMVFLLKPITQQQRQPDNS